MSYSIDPRDEGRPGLKDWEEFRASFGSAFLSVWFLDLVKDDDLADHLDRLQDWVVGAGVMADGQVASDPEDVPVVGPDDQMYFFDLGDARELEHQLFPHADSGADLRSLSYSLAVAGLYAPLEAYARSRRVRTKGLADNLAGWLAERGLGPRFDDETCRDLVDLCHTRHIVVHNRGIVDKDYLRALPWSTLHLGEIRPLTKNDLFRFARAAWRTAVLLREGSASDA